MNPARKEWTREHIDFDRWLAAVDDLAFEVFEVGVSDMPDLWMSRDAYDEGLTVREGLADWAELQAEDSSAFAEVFECIGFTI